MRDYLVCLRPIINQMEILPNYYNFNPVFSFVLNFREMSHKEAKEYFDWFVRQIPARMEMLQRATNTNNMLEFSPQILVLLGEFLNKNVQLRVLTDAEISQEQAKLPAWFQDFMPDKVLSDQTISLCVDIGIVLGEMLISAHHRLKWDFHHNRKNDVNYQQPILVGFRHKIELNPVRLVTIVAYKVADGESSENELLKLFNTWSKMV